MKIAIIVVILILNFSSIFAQENQAGIKRNFNYIEYYPDSTIKRAMNYEKYKPVGYCIEFDSLGKAKTIGEYRSGIRFGKWLNADGSFTNYFVNFDIVQGFPGCGTGMYHNRIRFKELYQELISKTN
jgi:hypothetical protein